jgi:RNA polymerase sigma-70 factor (ECF subfamily)
MIARAHRLLPVQPRKDTRVERVALLPFSGVYERHSDAVYRFCLTLLGDPATAEDVAAEAFSNACAAWPRQPEMDDAGVRRWIFRVARNAAIDHIRRQRRRALLLGRLGRLDGGGSNGHGPHAVDVETVAAIRAELRQVLDAVGGLKRRDRELVGMRVAGGLSYAEIAGVVGTSEQAARTATHRALTRVREAIGEGAR